MGIRVGKPHPDTAGVSRAWLGQACLRGQMPAGLLSTEDRQHLVHTLWKRGWTDAEIASHTLMSTYTAARIRSRLRLAPHRPVEGVA